MDWTTVDIDQLSSLLSTGASASIVGETYGITRNAAIGGVRRLQHKGLLVRGFSKKPVGGHKPRERRPRIKARVSGRKLVTGILGNQPKVVPLHEPERFAELAKFDANQVGCPLQQLRGNQCRWPVTGYGVTPILFCEGTKPKNAEGLSIGSYCPTHVHYNKRPYKEK